MSRQLEQMVSSLPARMRMAVVLRYQEEMEPAEIAEVMAIPVASVKSTLHRGLELLRAKVRRFQGRSEQ
jgi:RNA polymerase sigma-70 factor, ECF subfamily